MKKALYILFIIFVFSSCANKPPEYLSDESYTLSLDLFNPVYKDKSYNLFYTYDKKEYALYSDKSLYGGYNGNEYYGVLFEGDAELLRSLFSDDGFEPGYTKKYFSDNLYRLWEMSESGNVLLEMKDGSLYLATVETDPTTQKRKSAITIHPCEKRKALYLPKRNDSAFVDYTFESVYAGYTDEYFFPSLNAEKYYISSVKHLPINKYETKEELEEWLRDKGEGLSLEESYGEDFFKEHTLLSVYVQSNSGSYRYAPNAVVVKDDSLCAFVDKTNDPEVITCDMSGYMVFISVKKSDLEGVAKFDAIEGKCAILY